LKVAEGITLLDRPDTSVAAVAVIKVAKVEEPAKEEAAAAEGAAAAEARHCSRFRSSGRKGEGISGRKRKGEIIRL